MRFAPPLLVGLSLAVLSLGSAPDASACGGMLAPESENSLVTGHRMVFSVSTTETTLWDQLSYTGNPASFAWVLPIKGQVTVGLSSDALFEELENDTQVTVAAPFSGFCPSNCDVATATVTSTGNGGGGGAGGGVTVIAQQVVGPYDTVQLSSSDPTALASWLQMNGYVIPPSIEPVISAYITQGFDFLALKLVPGMGITAMQPVRVSTPGAGMTLPLRMVAAGAPTITPITLWIFGEGRYQPQNFPWFVITDKQLVWDFSTSSSNYQALKTAGFAEANGLGWLIETSTPFSSYVVSDDLTNLATNNPTHSGYADSMGNGAVAALDADLAKLYGDIPPGSLWLTRITAELPLAAFANDLQIGVAGEQTQVSGNLAPDKEINAPACPSPDTGCGFGGGGASGTGSNPSLGGCAVGSDGETPAALGCLVLALGVACSRRRPRRAR